MVMELVQGESLDVLIKAGPLPLKLALDYACQIAAALELAHDKVVHRDLKPGNIKITPEGTVKVLDFGLAGARCRSRWCRTGRRRRGNKGGRSVRLE
jgi:eukaryotic-like serine/threonine-protein kinase